MPRIALIHATPAAVGPIVDEFAAAWPAAELVNVLDDSLSRDRARDGRLTTAMERRFDILADYALSFGADAVLFTCSAFGPAIERVASRLAVPVLKPNEAMFAEALTSGRRIGMLATFAPSIPSMEEEFQADAARVGATVELQSLLVPGALDALNAGRPDEHARRIVEAGRALAGCDAIMLAQFSMAPVAESLRRAVEHPVLTSPGSAVAKLRARLQRPARSAAD
ncbi:MAG: aspartate/glutamate racemase family protein [Reyranella sp.]|uniref:aspartate/glutamate racemase family protein n=1 Tax=Reyranella sp. TaxID=1929291 RepID=UPI003D0FC1B3